MNRCNRRLCFHQKTCFSSCYNNNMNERFLHFRELLFIMTEKELRARYKYTLFGFFWIALNPLLQMLVVGFVFSFFIKEQVQNYYFFLFPGLLAWNFFSLSLTKTTPSILYERDLIKKADFPRSIIPLSIILSNLIHFLIAICLFSLIMILLGIFPLYRLPLLLVSILLLSIFTSGCCLLTTSLNVKFRDVNFFVQAILIIWFYATPILYPLSVIPQQHLWIWLFNPLTTVFQLIQFSLLGFPVIDLKQLVINSIFIIVITLIGARVFSMQNKYFDDWV